MRICGPVLVFDQRSETVLAAGIVPPVMVIKRQLAVPVPVACAGKVSALHVEPSVLTSTTSSDREEVVVDFDAPKERLRLV
jgi:hypothetical protein